MIEFPPAPEPRPTLSRALRQFLTDNATPFNADLIAEYLAAAPNIETQINVRTDIGEARSERLPSGKIVNFRLDGGQRFGPIRFPRQADSAPEWETMPELPWALDKYVADIGTTWLSAQWSLRVGFDVDSVFGHVQGLTAAELTRFERTIEPLDYVELRRSTGGSGRHLYVLLDGVTVANHTEHAAVARATLGKLCLDAGLDFSHQVDCLGGNMWIHSRRATAENRGFELLRPARRKLTADELPSNWREHVAVVARKRSTVVFSPGLTDDEERFWAELASANPTTPDDEHRRILDAYGKTGFVLDYMPDFGCWRAHTKALEQVHMSLGLRGLFRTKSPGTDPGTANCYLFLRPGGVFYVARYGSQDEDWPQRTAKGEAATLYNVPTDLKTACQAVGGVWGGKFCTVHTFAQAEQLAAMFGFKLPAISDRPINFKNEGATIVVEAPQANGDVPNGWALGYRKLTLAFPTEPLPVAEHDIDSVVRHVVTPERENSGWLLRDSDGNFNFEPKDTCRDALAHYFGLKDAELKAAMGKIAANPYLLVNEPFAPEFLPGRRWNKFGAQLAVAPTYGGNHPHYDLIFRHVGRGLDPAVRENEWCKRNGIIDGAHFLTLWAAKKFQHPKQHLPLLYLFSPERDNGKSAFHRSLDLFYKRGSVEGVRMLNEQFNKLLAGAVLVYLEEERVNANAVQKIKLYVDSDRVSIRMMRTDTYMLDNFTHWVASYNFPDAVPVEPGDERVIMVRVPVLMNDEKLDWKETLRPALEAEASDFLGTLLTMELPPSAGRLYLPVLSTELKREVCQSAEPTCDRQELIERIAAKLPELGKFQGRSRDLLAELGDGSWSASPNHFRRYLREIASALAERGIIVGFPTERTLHLERAA